MNRIPPLLTGATLLFWGWQTNFLLMGALLAVLSEGARVTRARWDLTDEDFNRVWNLTVLGFITAAVLAFTLNDGPEAVGRLFDEQGFAATRAAGETSQRTAASLIQWLPMVFALFALAHTLSRRGPLALPVFSLILRRQKPGGEVAPLAERAVNVGWVFFALCLVSASINTNEGRGFFLGASGLLGWALWPQRSRRYRFILWAGMVAGAGGLGYFSQQQLGEVRQMLENWTPQLSFRSSGRRTSPDHVNTQLGQIGNLKGSGQIVMRVAAQDGTPMPGLLRTASYRFYRSEKWGAWPSRSEVGERMTAGMVQPEMGGLTYILRSANSVGHIVVTTPLDETADLLPLPLGVTRLDNLIVTSFKTNTLGAAIVDGPGMAVFDVKFGYGGSIDSPPTAADLHIPDQEEEALDEALKELKLTGLSTNQILRTMSAWFQDNFTYRLWQPSRGAEQSATPLQWFLAPTNRAGHCEYFATATTLLLRRLGIPTRYAVGWAVQEAAGDDYIVRERHAHAWCLVYYNGQWHDFDTTPASWLAEENRRASSLQFLSDAWSWLKFEFLKWRAGQSTLRRYLWWIIGPMLLFLLYRLVRRRPGGQLRYPGGLEAELVRLGLDSEFYRVEQQLKQLGFVRAASETLGEFLERAVRHERVGALAEPLRALLRLHYQLRFDPAGLDAPARQALREGVRDAVGQITAKPAA